MNLNNLEIKRQAINKQILIISDRFFFSLNPSNLPTKLRNSSCLKNTVSRAKRGWRVETSQGFFTGVCRRFLKIPADLISAQIYNTFSDLALKLYYCL